MIYAYIRVSTAEQSYSGQHYELLHWANKNGITIDKWVTESVSGTVPPAKRQLGRLMQKLKCDDLLLCTEISRLGRNMLMIMSILNDCSAKGVKIHTVKDNFNLDNNLNSKIIAFAFALAAEIERNLISQRTKEALADLKASGVKLGRPPGSGKKREEILKNLPQIIQQRAAGESYVRIAAKYGVHRNTLVKYLKSVKC